MNRRQRVTKATGVAASLFVLLVLITICALIIVVPSPCGNTFQEKLRHFFIQPPVIAPPPQSIRLANPSGGGSARDIVGELFTTPQSVTVIRDYYAQQGAICTREIESVAAAWYCQYQIAQPESGSVWIGTADDFRAIPLHGFGLVKDKITKALPSSGTIVWVVVEHCRDI